jgi:hypothetical protein
MTTHSHGHRRQSACQTARCPHWPRCPDASAADRLAARAIASHPEQGWSLLCNGVVLFDDAGALLPEGRAIAPAAAPFLSWTNAFLRPTAAR